MALDRLDHYSVRTRDLDGTGRFYTDVLGLNDGWRPDFPFPGKWLYCGDQAVIHLIGIDPDDPSGLEGYLGAREGDALHGGGAVDHIAFAASDLDEMRRRLEGSGVDWREREVPTLGLHQIFVEDPNGIVIELNFPTTGSA